MFTLASFWTKEFDFECLLISKFGLCFIKYLGGKYLSHRIIDPVRKPVVLAGNSGPDIDHPLSVHIGGGGGIMYKLKRYNLYKLYPVQVATCIA